MDKEQFFKRINSLITVNKLKNNYNFKIDSGTLTEHLNNEEYGDKELIISIDSLITFYVDNYKVYYLGLICNDTECLFLTCSITQDTKNTTVFKYNKYIKNYLHDNNIYTISDNCYIHISYEYIFNIIIQINSFLCIIKDNKI